MVLIHALIGRNLLGLVLFLVVTTVLGAQAAVTKPTEPPKVAPSSSGLETKSFDVKYADPEQVRALFSGRSFVMEANRELKILTVTGSAAFLKEVEDTIKRFDVPPIPPANIQVTVYLLTTAAQAPAGTAVPKELATISKDFGGTGARLADTQVLRIREGEAGQVTGLNSKPESASLSRVWLQSAAAVPGAKGEMVGLYGLRVWLSVPSGAGATPQLRADPDVSADLDIDPAQVVMVSKVGVEQPVMVVVRATVIR